MKPTKREAAERGRPRDDAATDAILRTTLRLVAKKGYAGFRLEDVAREAHVSKATVYRRWPSKPAIVAAAVRGALAQANPAPPSTGDARADLETVLGNTIDALVATPFGPAVRALASEAMFDHDLSKAIKEVEVSRRKVMRAVVERCVEEGLLAGDVELLIDVLLAVPYFHLLVRQEKPSVRLAARVVDLLSSREDPARDARS